MKLLILHLSDIHFQKREDYSEDKVESIIKAIKTVKDCSTVVIIVSGDIAHAGKCNQYNVSYKFLSALRSRMKKAFSLNDIPILLVPGNHDIDYDRGSLSHKDLEMIYDEKKQDIELNNELNKMVAFYNLRQIL